MFLRVDMNSLESLLKKAAGSSFLFVNRLRIPDEETPELLAYDGGDVIEAVAISTDAIALSDSIVVTRSDDINLLHPDQKVEMIR